MAARRNAGHLMGYLYLGLAIVAEVIATSALARSATSEGYLPSLVTVAGYGVSFVFLSLTLRTMPVGVAYAIWSGVGIVLISIIGATFLGQKLDTPGLIGIGLIALGVVVVNGFSATTHL